MMPTNDILSANAQERIMTQHTTVENLINELSANLHEMNNDTADTFKSIYDLHGEVAYACEQFCEIIDKMAEEI